MTTLDTDNQSALLATVLHDPHDDAPRLIYSDWLTEHEASVECGRCGGRPDLAGGCLLCRNSGCVSNGFADRGKLIRVQVELDELERMRIVNSDGEICGWKRKKDRDRYDVLNECSRELLTAHGERWAMEVWEPYLRSIGHQPATANIPALHWSRGFINRVELSTADFMERQERCDRCRGDGEEPFNETMVDQYCLKCLGSGTVCIPGAAKAIAESVPVERVRLTDKSPGRNYKYSGDAIWQIRERTEVADRNEAPSFLKRRLFNLLEGGELAQFKTVRYYRDESAAITALEVACVQYARKLAGLPPLKGETR